MGIGHRARRCGLGLIERNAEQNLIYGSNLETQVPLRTRTRIKISLQNYSVSISTCIAATVSFSVF